MKQRKIPVRMCVACREGKPKKELIRIVRSQEGAVSVDVTGKAPGRGAYICKSQACFERLPRAGKRIEKAFGCKLPEELSARLGEEFERVRADELATAPKGDEPSGAG